MKFSTLMVLAVTFMVPAMALAGGNPKPPPVLAPVPTLGDAGLIALGVVLMGAGAAFLRKH